MKSILTLIAAVCFAGLAQSQVTQMQLYNFSSCPMYVVVNIADVNTGCGAAGTSTPIVLNYTGGTPVNLPTLAWPLEYVHVAVAEWPLSNGGFNVELDQMPAPCGCFWTTNGNIQTDNSTGCGSLTAEWALDCASNAGELYIYP